MWKAMWKIRVRLVLGFAACFLGVSLFVALSYSYFVQIEGKLLSLNLSDGLVNLTLEARRYEKNYFLYAHEADFQEALRYLGQVEQILLVERKAVEETMGFSGWSQWRDTTWVYRRSLSIVHETRSRGGSGTDGEELLQPHVNTIRSTGQELIGLAEYMAGRERVGIQALLSRYRILFGLFFLSTVCFGGLIVYLLEVKVVRPLSVIEKATRNVAEGRFETIEWNSGQDEISSLVRAFNRMVVQLEESREQMVRTEKLTALGTLTSGVAHELNNPLSNISTSCQILLEEADENFSDHHKQLLAAIEDQVVKARDIVRALLEFSRQREFQLRPVDLKEVVDDTLKLIKGDVPPRVQVRSEVGPGITLKADKARMQQAFINTIMNGIQAIEDEGTVTIRARRAELQGHILVEVEDTGSGIPPEVLPRVFDPFFTTKEVGRGTGLGLSVTYGIVERHNGRIWIESELGRGTKVVMQLPTAVPEET